MGSGNRRVEWRKALEDGGGRMEEEVMLTHNTYTRGRGWGSWRRIVRSFIDDFGMREERRFSTETATKVYLKERGGEVLHGLVEGDAEDENGERRGK